MRAGVRIERDEHGVNHVCADDPVGVSWGMGYCHALDRGLQMLLMRVLGQGRACELLADDESTLEIDRFFRRMGWAEELSEEVSRLDEGTRTIVDAYCDGASARFAERIPWELRLLGYRADPWTPEHCILMSRVIGYVTLAQSQAEMERLFVEMVQAGVDDARLRALFPHVTEDWDRELISSVRLGERIVPEGLRWLSAVPRAMASNNWVVSGARTRSGAPMLANDPHLEVNRLPCVWYEMGARWGEGRYALLATMPGIPAPLVGRTNDLAWGATYTFMDGVDSWVEEIEGGKRRRGDGWVELSVRREVIRRKKNPDVELLVHECEHGVLDGDPSVDGRYLATRWAPGRSGSASLMAGARLWEATSVKEGMAALGELETSWSWVLADREGHIGYQMSGLMPERREGVSGFVPLAGWDEDNDWRGFVPKEKLPRCFDPSEGFVVTANQDLNALGEVDPINLPMGDYRARRITELLAASNDMTIEDHARIQHDLVSIQARELMEILAPLLPDTPEARLLRDWDLRYDPASEAATLFEAFYREALALVFGPGGLGAPVVEHLWKDTGIFIDFYQSFDRALVDEQGPWLAGRDRAELFVKAFERASREPRRAWGEVNQVTLTHILFAGKLPGFLGFDVGPIPLPGGRGSPQQGQVYRSGDRDTSFAPSYRLIVDISEDAAHTALAGGPSDRRFSRWYTSDLRAWREGRYKTLRPARRD